MERKPKQVAKPDDSAMLDAVSAAAHQIWQAGLGAFARAQHEGGDLFDKLVQDGAELQQLTQRLGGEKRFSVTGTVSRLAENASRQASGSWDKLEKIFEERVSRSLRTLGVPAAAEVQALRGDVAGLKAALRALETRAQDDHDALQRSIAELKAAGAAGANLAAAKKRAAGPAPKAAAKAPARAAVKRAAAKPVAPKKTARSAS